MSRRELIKGGGKVTLVVNTVSNGSVTINGQSGTEFKFKRKESVLIQATANSSYYVASLSVNGANVSNPYTLVITENTTVIATMNIIAYGAITWSTAGSYGFTVPSNVDRLRINVRGGGGGGGGGGVCGPSSRTTGGNGGTGGQICSVIGVSPGQYFGVTVGGGGGGGAYTTTSTAHNGANGGSSSFGDYYTLGGGGGGGAYIFNDGRDLWPVNGAAGTSYSSGGANGGAGGRGVNNGAAGDTGSVSIEWGAGI